MPAKEETLTGLVTAGRPVDRPPQKSRQTRFANLWLTLNGTKKREQLKLEFNGEDSNGTTAQHGDLINQRVEVTGIGEGIRFHVRACHRVATL